MDKSNYLDMSAMFRRMAERSLGRVAEWRAHLKALTTIDGSSSLSNLLNADEKILWSAKIQYVRRLGPFERNDGYQGQERLSCEAIITIDDLFWKPESPHSEVRRLSFLDIVGAEMRKADTVLALYLQPFGDFEPELGFFPQTPFECLLKDQTPGLFGVVEHQFAFLDRESWECVERLMGRPRMAICQNIGHIFFAALNAVPVSDWTMCPVCGGRILERNSHVVKCGICQRHYTDPNHRPYVKFNLSEQVIQMSTLAWTASIPTEYRFMNRTLVWAASVGINESQSDGDIEEEFSLDLEAMNKAANWQGDAHAVRSILARLTHGKAGFAEIAKFFEQ